MDELLRIFPRDLILQFFMQLSSCIRLIVSVLLFMYPLRKKRAYGLRLSLALFLCAAALVAMTWIRFSFNTVHTRIVMHLVQFCMPLMIIMLTCEGSVISRLKVLCASISAAAIGLAVFSYLQFLVGNNLRTTISLFPQSEGSASTLLDWIIFFGINTLVYYGLYRLFRYEKHEELDSKSGPATVLLTAFCLFIQTVPDCLRMEFMPDSIPLLLFDYLYQIFLSIFVLLYCSDITFRSQYRSEKQIMDQVLREERKRYVQMKENIDVINMRCHDLRHQLDDFSGRLTEREIDELRDAMDFYDSNIKTGSEVLDVVLRLSQLTCQKEGIQLSCLADGTCLSFMRTRHVYSLFNNALSNAVEAVKKVTNPEKKVISLSVGRHLDTVEIEVTNYFDGIIAAPGETTKEDAHHHGFGTMSMRYIAAEYGGSVSMQTQKDIYTLHISIPVPADKA